MEIEKQPWSKEFPLIRDSSKCIKCMRCIQVCDKVQSLSIWDVEGTGSRTTINVAGYKKIEEAACSLCGQCITHCPTGALTERDETEKVWNAIADPEKIVVVQIAPLYVQAGRRARDCQEKKQRLARSSMYGGDWVRTMYSIPHFQRI